MKKLAVILLIILILLTGCSGKVTMKNVSKQPNFRGIVTEVNEHSILVKVNEDEDEIRSSDLMNVSLSMEIEDSLRNLM